MEKSHKIRATGTALGGLMGAVFKGTVAMIGVGALAGLGAGVLLHDIYEKRKKFRK